MLDASCFLAAASGRGFDLYTGVPCSFLTPLINRVGSESLLTLIGAASEGEAVAIAAGAWLAGRQTVVMCQNSGLGNAINPLTSLNAPFRIPTLIIVTWRGQPGLQDEPQHELMGRITRALLETIEVGHHSFPDNVDTLARSLDIVCETMARTSLPFALVMAKNSLAEETWSAPPLTLPSHGWYTDLCERGNRPSRASVLERLLSLVPATAAIVATTGKTGRELFTLQDRDQHLYQVGSMGCAAPMGLGIALNTAMRTIVLDGDGAALMKLGAMATIGAYQPKNLTHILLDNGVHDSTGGQPTVSASVDFGQIALACGYSDVYSCDSIPGFIYSFGRSLAVNGPTLIHVRIKPGSMAHLGRPTIAPHEVAQRFRSFLRQQDTWLC